MKAIIGHTGFVGSNLVETMKFDYLFNSKNINQISNYDYDLIICSAISSLKWFANKNPYDDLSKINNLIDSLRNIKCNKFVLISTIDICVDNSYGRNRRYAEIEFEKIFGDILVIVRLPSVFGNNLKKNILYDLINNKLYGKLNLCDTHQWYDVRDLSDDIDFILKNQISEINLFSEPITMKEIVDVFFKINPDELYFDCDTAVKYDLKCDVKSTGYWRSKEEIINKLKNHLK